MAIDRRSPARALDGLDVAHLAVGRDDRLDLHRTRSGSGRPARSRRCRTTAARPDTGRAAPSVADRGRDPVPRRRRAAGRRPTGSAPAPRAVGLGRRRVVELDQQQAACAGQRRGPGGPGGPASDVRGDRVGHAITTTTRSKWMSGRGARRRPGGRAGRRGRATPGRTRWPRRSADVRHGARESDADAEGVARGRARRSGPSSVSTRPRPGAGAAPGARGGGWPPASGAGAVEDDRGSGRGRAVLDHGAGRRHARPRRRTNRTLRPLASVRACRCRTGPRRPRLVPARAGGSRWWLASPRSLTEKRSSAGGRRGRERVRVGVPPEAGPAARGSEATGRARASAGGRPPARCSGGGAGADGGRRRRTPPRVEQRTRTVVPHRPRHERGDHRQTWRPTQNQRARRSSRAGRRRGTSWWAKARRQAGVGQQVHEVPGLVRPGAAGTSASEVTVTTPTEQRPDRRRRPCRGLAAGQVADGAPDAARGRRTAATRAAATCDADEDRAWSSAGVAVPDEEPVETGRPLEGDRPGDEDAGRPARRTTPAAR